MPGTLLIRADAGPDIGMGHVMRCLALAEAWVELGGVVVLLSSGLAEGLRRRWLTLGASLEELHERPGSRADRERTSALSRALGAAWVVVDGYQFDADYQEGIVASGLRLLWIDDEGRCAPYTAQVILNPNLHASEGLYQRRRDNVRLLLGPSYTLLRREFRIAPRRTRAGRRLVLAMGGADPQNLSQWMIEALFDAQLDELTIILGQANPHKAQVREKAEQSTRDIRILLDVDNMAEVLSGAELMVCAAGSTVWEAAALEMPIAVLVVADNQRPVAQSLASRGAAVVLGEWGLTDPSKVQATLHSFLGMPIPQLEAMAARLGTLIERDGSVNVCNALLAG